MKKNLLWFVLSFLPALAFAQSPFDGTWKTNMTASKLSQKPYEFSLNNGTYSCGSCVPKMENVKADGHDQNVAAPGRDYDTLAVKIVDDHSARFTGKKAGKPVYEQTRSTSRDGSTLTIASMNYPADGSQAFKTEVKFTRVGKAPAGANATSGSWRIQNVSEDEAGLTSTWKRSGDGLSMSTPTGVSWEAKLDGKEYPVKGSSYDRYTVSVKSLGDRSIEATYRRDGKVATVDKITVSADGKQMTIVADNKLSGRISTYIDEKQ